MQAGTGDPAVFAQLRERFSTWAFKNRLSPPRGRNPSRAQGSPQLEVKGVLSTDRAEPESPPPRRVWCVWLPRCRLWGLRRAPPCRREDRPRLAALGSSAPRGRGRGRGVPAGGQGRQDARWSAAGRSQEAGLVLRATRPQSCARPASEGAGAHARVWHPALRRDRRRCGGGVTEHSGAAARGPTARGPAGKPGGAPPPSLLSQRRATSGPRARSSGDLQKHLSRSTGVFRSRCVGTWATFLGGRLSAPGSWAPARCGNGAAPPRLDGACQVSPPPAAGWALRGLKLLRGRRRQDRGRAAREPLPRAPGAQAQWRRLPERVLQPPSAATRTPTRTPAAAGPGPAFTPTRAASVTAGTPRHQQELPAAARQHP